MEQKSKFNFYQLSIPVGVFVTYTITQLEVQLHLSKFFWNYVTSCF